MLNLQQQQQQRDTRWPLKKNSVKRQNETLKIKTSEVVCVSRVNQKINKVG